MPYRVETFWEKEKLLVTSNFSFSHNVFYSNISLVRQNAALCGNGLIFYHIMTFHGPEEDGVWKHWGKRRKCWVTNIFFFNFLLNNKILDWSKLKAFADEKINVTKKIEICCGKGRKHCEKRRKCWLPAFSPFSHNVFKTLRFQGHLKSGLCSKELNNVFYSVISIFHILSFI